jgi:hypothetical protein
MRWSTPPRRSSSKCTTASKKAEYQGGKKPGRKSRLFVLCCVRLPLYTPASPHTPSLRGVTLKPWRKRTPWQSRLTYKTGLLRYARNDGVYMFLRSKTDRVTSWQAYFIRQIPPFRIHTFDKLQFLFPRTCLDLFFSQDCQFHRTEAFIIN